MTLRKAKQLTNSLGLGALFCAMATYLLPKFATALLILMIVLGVAMAVVKILFWRCPHCGKALGRDSKKTCQHCGTDLNTDQ